MSHEKSGKPSEYPHFQQPNAPPYPHFEPPPAYGPSDPNGQGSVSAMPPLPPGVPYSGNPYPPHGSGQPITNQPVTTQGVAVVSWATTQTPASNDPLGYLASVDQLLVHQQVELLEAMTGFETKNKYRVKNSLGQEVFLAKEKSGCCNRNCCGPIRPFDMKIYDNFKNEVIHLYRPLACTSCCFPCCLQTLEVSAPPGNIIGKVKQRWSIFFPAFSIENAHGETMYRIEGPFWTCSCCCNDVKFRITSADGKRDVGKITKQWSGLLREGLTDADHFGITFPMDMDIKMKAVMLGACFLIDFMYFEQTGNQN